MRDRGISGIETTTLDVRHAFRALWKAPGFTAVAAFTLALGIGANTAIFSVIEAVVLRPLPYRDPCRLLLVSDPQDPKDDGILYGDFEAWKSQSRSFEEMAVYYRNSGFSRVTLTGAEPEQVQGAFVSADFFPVMGVSPLLGRGITADEETRRERVVVLSHGLWSRRFGRSPDVLGKALEIDGILSQVIGVMPATFQFPARDSQFWAPITTNRYWGDPELLKIDPSHGRGFYARWRAIGRLRPGAAALEARTEMNVNVVPLRVNLSGNTRLAFGVLLGAVSFVLLIACCNVANLVLARGAARERELAVRVALGAGRGRLVRQQFTESAVLALLAGGLGLVLAAVGIQALAAFGPADIPRLDEAGLDAEVLAFTLAISLFSATVFGLAPAWKISRVDPNEALKAGGRGQSGSMRGRGLLVILEFALSVVLLTGAGLLVRSFLALEAVDPGFRPEHVLTMRITMPADTPNARRTDLDERTLERVRSIPGVEAAGAIDGLFGEEPQNFGLRSVEGKVEESRARWMPLAWSNIRGDYVQAIGARLLRGRFFSERDSADSPLVAIVDESMARRYWPDEDALGKRFKGFDARGHNDEWLTVIGVVADMRRHGLERQPAAHIYQWYRQAEAATPDLVVRTSGDPRALAATLRDVVRGLDRTAILSSVKTVEQQLAEQLSPRRFETGLLGLFSSIALALASIGIYGVMHYSVERRTHEIGVRMALGAQPSDVLRMVMGQGLWLATAGLGAGLAGARAWLGRGL